MRPHWQVPHRILGPNNGEEKRLDGAVQGRHEETAIGSEQPCRGFEEGMFGATIHVFQDFQHAHGIKERLLISSK